MAAICSFVREETELLGMLSKTLTVQGIVTQWLLDTFGICTNSPLRIVNARAHNAQNMVRSRVTSVADDVNAAAK